MSLADDFRNVLTGVRDLVGDQATQTAITGDIGLIEQLVASGASVEQHIAQWFHAAYNTTPGVVQSPIAAVPPVPAADDTPADGTAAATPPAATVTPDQPVAG